MKRRCRLAVTGECEFELFCNHREPHDGDVTCYESCAIYGDVKCIDIIDPPVAEEGLFEI